MSKRGYGGMLTREQFCFFETRTVARLMLEGMTEEELISEIVEENLFQYPTEKTLKSIAKACYKRMKTIEETGLLEVVATGGTEEARQICLYAMMQQYPLVRDFMTKVVGEKYRVFDMTLTNMDMNSFFLQLRDSNDEVAEWTDSTIAKLKQVLRKILVENEYLDDARSEKLNPVFLESRLANVIQESGDLELLPAFNYLI